MGPIMIDTIFSEPGITGPVLGAIVGAIFVAISRFVWNNYNRSSENSKRLDRLARTIFGDESDVSRSGIMQHLLDLDKKVDCLDSRLDEIDRKLDHLCEGYEAEEE